MTLQKTEDIFFVIGRFQISPKPFFMNPPKILFLKICPLDPVNFKNKSYI